MLHSLTAEIALKIDEQFEEKRLDRYIKIKDLPEKIWLFLRKADFYIEQYEKAIEEKKDTILLKYLTEAIIAYKNEDYKNDIFSRGSLNLTQPKAVSYWVLYRKRVELFPTFQ